MECQLSGQYVNNTQQTLVESQYHPKQFSNKIWGIINAWSYIRNWINLLVIGIHNFPLFKSQGILHKMTEMNGKVVRRKVNEAAIQEQELVRESHNFWWKSQNQTVDMGMIFTLYYLIKLGKTDGEWCWHQPPTDRNCRLSPSRMRCSVIILYLSIVLMVLEHHRNERVSALFWLEISNSLLLHTMCIPSWPKIPMKFIES